MANSRKSKSNSVFSKAENVLREQIQCGNHLAVALSGGVDSVVLLDFLVPLSAQMQFSLSAIHVNHGISINADQWSIFCRNLCRSSGVPLKVVRLKINQEPGVSLEATARDERYRVFGKLKADYVVLAQHLDDQAETLLLQLLRGAGVRGLGAMPVVRHFAAEINKQGIGAGTSELSGGRPRILRPFLEVSRREIEDYASEHALQWITDESNDDISFDRNFLRHEFFPLLEKRFPSYRTTFMRASRHMAEASCLLDELAEADSKACVVPGKLHVEDLRNLGFLRAKNLLRYILAQQGAILPSTIKLEEILRQMLSSRPDTKLHLIFGNTEVRCFKGEVHVRSARSLRKGTSPVTEWRLVWKGEQELTIAELGGTLKLTRHEGAGLNLQKLSGQAVTIRPRRGGERLRPDCNRPRRSLKNLLREASLPPWEREALPLIFSEERLVCVPGIGVDCDFQAVAGEPGLLVEWQPTPDLVLTGEKVS
ncbi:tRNA lysidine(34) synthetase TilS [Nitrosovibrio sp. Nv4]|uniref:tRNA lysidine(34) synthetase TilS n=1 Tax=Nitrosovibrio sp. Nv4 TaxID=1945880 RepID=UPI000BD792BE|nr:tRNA lysidine(34) synthetase TilS [Nitrosovibrio sp. Nv4]SOD42101.1 tRNA(Ile)-lysidine synthase [Nitrosovibrio sp. Nv4]